MKGGIPGAPPIWLVHAFGDSSSVFEEMREAGLGSDFQIFAPDWPTTGDTSGVDVLEDVAAGLARSVERSTPTGPVGFVGHSLGAALAVRVASRTRRVVGLFSIEGNLTAADAYFSGLAADFEAPREFHESLLGRVRAAAAREPPERRDALLRYHASLRRVAPEALWRIGRCAKVASRKDALGDEYRALAVPTLYYWSRESTRGETQGYVRKHALRHRNYTGGHWPMVERPEETSRAIREFFEPLFGAPGESR